MRPRKDYGSPLRIYRTSAGMARFTVLPPRSARTMASYKDTAGYWRALVSDGYRTRAANQARPGPHLGQRIAWAELPPPVQAALRTSFLGEYCPKEEA